MPHAVDVSAFLKQAAVAGDDDSLAHFGVKGMKWGVRRDERALSDKDKALNMSQRSQVRVASTISALAATGMSMNAAATLFTLQARIERYQAAAAILREAENHPLIDDATREGLRQAKNHVMQGIIGSAMATTAVSIAIGVVTQRTAKAYFAPMHKVYGDSKPKINSELRTLSKDIKAGKRPHLTVKDYNKEVARIVEKHMTSDKKNLLSPFHELARQQLGLQYGTKKLSIKFEKLPNTDLYDKMTVMTPEGLKLVKAIKKVEHSALYEDADLVGDVDFFFDYKFDAEGYIEEWSCPTLEVANDLMEGRFNMDESTSKFDPSLRHADRDEDSLVHAERTIQNILDERTPEQIDLQDLIVGAALSYKDISKEPGIVEQYEALPKDHQYLIHFIVGSLLSDGTTLKHVDISDDELMHFGIKGMKWGIRKSEPSSGDSSTASTKSNGRRAANLLLGDKTFWKRTALIGGVAAVGLGAAFAAPYVLPAGALSAIGSAAAGYLGAPSAAGFVMVNGQMTTLVALGQVTASAVLTSASAAVVGIGSAANVRSNTRRAFSHSAPDDVQYAQFGKLMVDRQVAGMKRVYKTLGMSNELAQSAIFDDDDSIMHYGIKGMKWGIRRSDVQLALVNRKQGKIDAAQAKLDAKSAALGVKKASGGSSDKTIDDPSDFSEDALKLAQTAQKPASALSTKEIQDALLRANITKQYDQIFNPSSDPNAELRRKVEQLNLQKQYAQLTREMTPPTRGQKFRSSVTSLVKSSSKGYKEYLSVDKATGGALSTVMGEAFRAKGKTVAGKHRGPGKILRPPSTTAAMAKAAAKAAKKAKNP